MVGVAVPAGFFVAVGPAALDDADELDATVVEIGDGGSGTVGAMNGVLVATGGSVGITTPPVGDALATNETVGVLVREATLLVPETIGKMTK